MAKCNLNEVHQQIKTSSCCICISMRTEPMLQHSARPRRLLDGAGCGHVLQQLSWQNVV